MKLGRKIKELRKSNRYSQEELAELMNVSSCAVSKWESELSYPDLSNLVRLANLFNVSVDYLLDNNILRDNEETIVKKIKEMIKEASYQYDIKKIKEIHYRFPNSFLIVFFLANYLFHYGFEDNRKEELEYSLILFYKALELINIDKEYLVYEDEIKNSIVNIYLKFEKYSEVIDFIDKYHVSNHLFLKGICYANQNMNEKALDELSKNYCETLLSLTNVCAYEAVVLYRLNKKQEALDLLDFISEAIDKVIIDKNSILVGCKVALLTCKSLITINEDDSSLLEIIELSKGYKRHKVINQETMRFCYSEVLPVTSFNDDLIMQAKYIAKNFFKENEYIEYCKVLDKKLEEK